MVIAGVVYDREMPGFAPVMNDAEIASLLSFIRRRFGGSKQPVEAADVSRVRAAHAARSGYWHTDELK
jgi:mono/diheme cytochrome c family protein